MSVLEDKRILLCVGGGIAAYKAPEVVRRLIEVGAEVQVAMTKGAHAFITPLTLQAVSGRPVATDLLDPVEDATIGHIELAETADAILVAPATADLIARMAAGMADDIVTAALLASTCPVVVSPAMNTHMLSHPATQANLAKISEYGYRLVEPDSGVLACGYEGAGRMPDAPVLLESLAQTLAPQDMAGIKVLVSAGPTREPLDPVRVLTNRSSGRMGYAVAAAAALRGASVTLVSGPTNLAPPAGCDVVPVETAAEMAEAVHAHYESSDAVVMVAAVADYRPAAQAKSKIKKKRDALTIELEKTEDILGALGKNRGDRVLVGFAAETDNVEDYARGKLAKKNLDLIVANDVSAEGVGFDVSTNAATLIDRDGERTESGLVTKDALAHIIWDRVLGLVDRS